MKKIVSLALSLALTLCACSSSGQIPSLEEIVENGAEWSNEQLHQSQGCTLADLEKVWGEADGELRNEYAYFWRVDGTTSVNVYYHKNAEIEHITVTSLKEGDDTYRAETTSGGEQNDLALQDIPVSVAETGDSDVFEMSTKNAETILQILNADRWVSGETDCASDYIVTFNDRVLYYHSDCGTFNERLDQSYQNLRLSETEQETVNDIIWAVIPD